MKPPARCLGSSDVIPWTRAGARTCLASHPRLPRLYLAVYSITTRRACFLENAGPPARAGWFCSEWSNILQVALAETIHEAPSQTLSALVLNLYTKRLPYTSPSLDRELLCLCHPEFGNPQLSTWR